MTSILPCCSEGSGVSKKQDGRRTPPGSPLPRTHQAPRWHHPGRSEPGKGQLHPGCPPGRLIPWTRAPPRGRGPAALLPRELSVRRRVPRPCARPRAVSPAAPEPARLPGASSAPGGAAVGEVAGLPRGCADGGRPGQANEPREGAEAGGPAMATGCAPPPLQDWPRGRPSPAARRPRRRRRALHRELLPCLPPAPPQSCPESRARSGGLSLAHPQCEWTCGLSDQRAPAPLDRLCGCPAATHNSEGAWKPPAHPSELRYLEGDEKRVVVWIIIAGVLPMFPLPGIMLSALLHQSVSCSPPATLRGLVIWAPLFPFYRWEN